MKIKLNSTNSVNSLNKDTFSNIEIKQTTKPFHYLNIKETVDQYEVFKEEKENCNKYRLILTINPYCTNVLFNTLTEIIKDEGSDRLETIGDNSKAKSCGKAYGNTTPNRYQMIRNTEYSRDEINYEYLPGYDIFNNHILRNTSFKLVNYNNNKDRDVFNTIEDYMRYSDGSNVKFRKRNSISSISNEHNRHLYLADDILNITDSINANLSEQNGWWGFINSSTLKNKYRANSNSSKWDSLGIEHVICNRKNCEFIDMYPDRTLYSFNPKYNSFKNRLEYNWDICITYPSDNYYDHPLIQNSDYGINALKICSIDKMNGINGNEVIVIKTYVRHGLKQGDSIYIYFDGVRTNRQFKIYSLGDINSNNKDYIFIINGIDILDEIGKIDNNNVDYRLNRVVNGVESSYYIRKFTKLPNFKARKTLLTEEIASDKENFKKYIRENALKDGKIREFDKEQYQLAFASTVYNDNSTQITFTDGIDISNMKDNLGRPLTEMYITIIKNNKGYKKWYNTENKFPTDYKDEDYEYSHCFGRLCSGFEMMYGGYLDSEKYSDVRKLNNISTYDMCLEGDGEINKDDDFFYGDVVSFNPNECIENVLSDVCFRFNTAQREWNADKNNWIGQFRYDEITSDDYDYSNGEDSFNAEEKELNTDESCDTIRPEGYYYKAHYRIPLRGIGGVKQSSHHSIIVESSACTVVNSKVFVQVNTKLRHKLSSNDSLLFFDALEDKWYSTKVVYIMDSTKFLIGPQNILDNNGNSLLGKQIPQLELVNLLNNMTTNHMLLLKKNTDIPSYATQIKGENTFLWRDIVPLEESSNNDDSNIEYIFANGYYYINKDINFYLKRQDPEGKLGLYTKDGFPNDVFGNIKKESNYEYKDETHIKC